MAGSLAGASVMAFSNGSDSHAALFSATDCFIVAFYGPTAVRKDQDLGGDRTVEKRSD